MDDGGAAEAFERRDWPAAYEALQAAARAPQPRALDIERLGLVAQLLGEDDEGCRVWERAHHAYLELDDPASAARCAFWLSMSFMQRGQTAHAGGWLSRAQTILDERQLDCPERGLVRIPQALQLLEAGDVESAAQIFAEIRALGRRFGDADLTTLGCLGGGQALIRRGDVSGGAAHLDEAMISVLAGEVSPIVAGIVYCAVIEACHEMFDVRRAHEWTEALTKWCDDQTGLVLFRGRCQVYRSELMQLHGKWEAALEVAPDAERRLSGPPMHPEVGTAYYQQGELQRLRGALVDAEEAFRRAEMWGRRPQPGMALLSLAQGKTDAAATAIRHALNESRDVVSRASLLAAAVEVFAASGDIPGCRDAAEELARLAVSFDSAWLAAAASLAAGTLALVADDPETAASRLQSALADWQRLDAPYEAARTRLLLARAAMRLGDSATAEAQTEAARRTLEDLGAAADVRLKGSVPETYGAGSSGLTPREVEVLRLVARGMTNRAIAASLSISERTAANHVGNIFGKLGLSSRAAATAYAYENSLV